MMDGDLLHHPSSLPSLSLLLPPYYHPNHQRLITPDKSEAEHVNDIFTVAKQEKHGLQLMNGSIPCDTRACTTRANRPICVSPAQIYGLHIHHGRILRLQRGGSRSWKGCPPAHRWGFHPGLIRASTGGDRWPAERNRDCPPHPPHPHPAPVIPQLSNHPDGLVRHYDKDSFL